MKNFSETIKSELIEFLCRNWEVLKNLKKWEHLNFKRRFPKLVTQFSIEFGTHDLSGNLIFSKTNKDYMFVYSCTVYQIKPDLAEYDSGDPNIPKYDYVDMEEYCKVPSDVICAVEKFLEECNVNERLIKA